MKTMLQMMVYSSMALLLSVSMLFGNSGSVSDESRSKERAEKPGWIGIMIQDVNKKIARKEKLDSEEGTYKRLLKTVRQRRQAFGRVM